MINRKLITKLRKQNGWTLAELSKRAKITIPALHMVEKGKVGNPRISTLTGIAKALGCGIQDLVK